MKRKTILILAFAFGVCAVATYLFNLPFGSQAVRQLHNERATPPSRKSDITGVIHTNLHTPVDPINNSNNPSARNTLDQVTQLAKDGRIESAARALAQNLSGNWRESLSFDEITAVVRNSSAEMRLRTLLIDILIHTGDLTADEKDRLSQTLLAVAESPDTDNSLRRYALLGLRDGMARDQTIRLQNIAERPETPPEVRGASITALRRTGAETHNTFVSKILDNAATADTEVLRHAVVSAAKGGMAANRIGTLREIAMTTKSADLYASTVYALGMVGTQEAVAAIMDVVGGYDNEHIVRYALRNSQEVILKMLAVGQTPKMVATGIQAARRGGIRTAIQPLTILRDTHSEASIRSDANDAIAVLSAADDINSKQPRE
jgi:hypothetical protein